MDGEMQKLQEKISAKHRSPQSENICVSQSDVMRGERNCLI